MKYFCIDLFSLRLFSVIWICFILLFQGADAQDTIQDKLKNDPDISEFNNLLLQCKVCNFTLENEPLTVFAPVNAAFQKSGSITEDPSPLVQYHLTNIPKKIEQLGVSYTSINTRLPGGPPIWITITPGRYNDAYYVNNARLLTSQSNIMGTKGQTRGGPVTQILHKIDEVLVPTISSDTNNPIFNPNAWEFLENYESLIQGSHRVRNFRQKVQQYSKQDVFRTEGGHTFFIPVDEGFENNRAKLIDGYIIDGHVIPKHVLFTTPTRKDSPFQTLADGDNMVRVVISFTQEQRQNTVINYVKSHTLFSKGTYPEGVVLAEIVKANIPVKNGVIHLIHKPLMIVDRTIKELLEDHVDYICNVGNVQRMENIWEETPHHVRYFFDYEDVVTTLNLFFNDIAGLGPEGQSFLRTIEKTNDLTLFAPCNNAMDSEIVRSYKMDKQKFLEILKMHVVVDYKLSVEQARKQNEQKVHQYPTMVKGKNLYFNVATVGNNRTMTVEAGGVNATVIQPDLAAINGIVHIIDKVLGIPYSTVLEKLSTDPMLSDTYELGKKRQFNQQLNETHRKFTYFVPRNWAWQQARVVMPSTIKKLFMDEYSYHAYTTLQRHLVISNEVYTMERIKQMTKDKENNQSSQTNRIGPPLVELPALRGSLKLAVEEKLDNNQRRLGSAYTIYWEGMRIPVFRPNVECTNGIIHVIDGPFLREGDVRVSGSAIMKPSIILSLLTFVLAKFLAE